MVDSELIGISVEADVFLDDFAFFLSQLVGEVLLVLDEAVEVTDASLGLHPPPVAEVSSVDVGVHF